MTLRDVLPAGSFLLTLTILVVGVWLGMVATKATSQPPTVVTCDSTDVAPVTDPRAPYLRGVILGCVLGSNVNTGAPVTVELID